ncbi:MAG: sulfatase [Armatimonadetes bacterium CG07_land_8_20_14_0_80_59_28]|nr:MAG: sulfatase [Armatimonadetes bacterium CG07_land_8_20_14_0_80_59_28]PIX39166.1 MAG: sulfatase [Armatimonadetes bacterium CG_4_8_14_3_um_filter_58_9]
MTAARELLPGETHMPGTRTRPNILLVVTDQHRFDCLGANDNAIIQTPALDSLTREGMRFDRAYSCIGLCSPARASLLTGLYPHNHGVFTNIHDIHGVTQWESLPNPLETLPGRLSRAGYQTAHTGKWHLGPHSPLDHGYHRIGTWDGDGAQDRYRQDLISRLDTSGWETRNAVARRLPNGREFPFCSHEPGPPELSPSAFIAETAIDLLNEFARDDDHPFFITANFYGPHLPFRTHEPFSSMYHPAEIPEWPAFRDTLDGKPFQHRRMREYWGTEGLPWSWWQPVVAACYGFISMIDAQIGRVLTRLDKLGLAENTLVCYTTDHGDTCGDRGMFDKGYTMYEELYHIPLLVRWPGVVEAGSNCAEFVNSIDLAPTWMEVANAGCFERCDGRSLLPLLRGQQPSDWPQEVVCEFHGMQWSLTSQRMLRDRRHKYVWNGTDREELYDLDRDPAELENIADDQASQHVKRGLRDRLFNKMWETGDHFATWISRRPDNPRYTRYG